MFVRRLLTAVPANASLFAQTGVRSSVSAALLRPACMTPVSAFTPLRFFSEDASEGSSERRQGGFNRAPRRRQDNREQREPREYKAFTTDDFKTSSVLIVNLPYTLNAQGVKDAFASVGNIEYVKILRRDDGLPLGRAIVRFSEVSSAQAAFEKFNATELPGTGRKVHLKPAQQPQNRFIVFVAGLPAEATTEQLTEFFASAGNVLSARIREGRNDGAVFFATEEEAQKAIQLNGSTFQGTSIRVNLPQPRNNESEGRVEESS